MKIRSTNAGRVSVAVAVVLLCWMTARASAQSQANQKSSDRNTIQVKVNLVTAPVIVRDASGEMVRDLEQKDFRVYDNGIEQKIEHFDVAEDPLSVVLVVECNDRVDDVMPAIRKSGIVLTQAVLGDTGEGAVVKSSGVVNVEQEMTSDHDKIESAITELEHDGTSRNKLYDALAQAEDLLGPDGTGKRRVIIAISEATDRGSATKLGEVLRRAQLANITIYTVGLSSTAQAMRNTLPDLMAGQLDFLTLGAWLVQHPKDEVKAHALEATAAATGGAHLPAFRDRSLEPQLDRIGDELRTEYVLSYRPSDDTLPGYHTIKVVVDRPQMSVRARPGYFLAAPDREGQ